MSGGALPGEGRWTDLRRPNRARALTLAALGALAGLAMAGVSLFTAKGTISFIVPPEDVAAVNDQPISRLDYLAQLRALYDVDLQGATPAQRRKTLDDMIREELFVQRGRELDVASVDPDVRAAMVRAVEQQVAADALTAQPTEAQLRAYFDAHRDRYASEGVLAVRDLLFPPRAADAAAAALRTGATPAAVLARFGGRETHAVTGEEFYFAAKIHLGAAAFAAAAAAPSGAVVQAPGGHVLLVLHNIAPKPFDFAQARDQVLADDRDAMIAKLQRGEAAFLRKRANIRIAADLR